MKKIIIFILFITLHSSVFAQDFDIRCKIDGKLAPDWVCDPYTEPSDGVLALGVAHTRKAAFISGVCDLARNLLVSIGSKSKNDVRFGTHTMVKKSLLYITKNGNTSYKNSCYINVKNNYINLNASYAGYMQGKEAEIYFEIPSDFKKFEAGLKEDGIKVLKTYNSDFKTFLLLEYIKK